MLEGFDLGERERREGGGAERKEGCWGGGRSRTGTGASGRVGGVYLGRAGNGEGTTSEREGAVGESVDGEGAAGIHRW